MKKNEIPSVFHAVDEGEGINKIHYGSRAAIVNISSISGYIAQPEFVPYNTSKSAIMGMSRCTALDFAKDKIRVNCVCPGSIETRGSYNHMKAIK
eukprot:UN32381